MAPADLALLFVYGAVIIYFVGRWVRFRVAASLGVALLPMGWIVLALHAFAPVESAVKWAGVGAGLALLVLVLQADRGDTRR